MYIAIRKLAVTMESSRNLQVLNIFFPFSQFFLCLPHLDLEVASIPVHLLSLLLQPLLTKSFG